MSDIESNHVKKPSLGRRKFLTKTAAAAVVGAIPARSVWATGVTNSIMASGHGSDFAGGEDLQLLGPCEILRDFSNNSNLQLKFSDVFGGTSSLSFYDILDCYCCPATTLTNAISNVVTCLENGQRIKIDEYPDEHKDPNHPKLYFSALEDMYSSPVVDYVIKAGNSGNGRSRHTDQHTYHNRKGEEMQKDQFGIYTPSWFTGHQGDNVDGSVDADQLSYASLSSLSSDCDQRSVLMVTVYLNAVLDLEARMQGGTYSGIFYPILQSATDAPTLASSISGSSDFDLSTIITVHGGSTTAACPIPTA